MKNILALALVLIGLCPVWADNELSLTPPQPTLTVNGSSTIRVIPDQMQFVAEIMSTDPSREKAKATHDQALKQTLDFLKAEGSITELQTGGMRVDKQQFSPQINPKPPTPVYTCTTQFTFTLSDLAKYGAITDELLKIQNLLVDNTTYAYSKATETRHTAMIQAVARAHDDAQALAAAANCTIIGVQNIQYSGGMQPRPFIRMATPMMAGSPASGTPPTEAGQIEITEDVSITYKIDNTAVAH